MKLHILALIPALVLTSLISGCKGTSHPVQPAELGRPATINEMLEALSKPGPITFTKHVAADWAVPLSGLLNLDHPAAQAAGLEDKEEAIQIFTYSLVHPKYGVFIVDSGVAESFIDMDTNQEASWLVKQAMNMPALKVRQTSEQLAAQLGGIDGVLLTHIHLDHIMGLPGLPKVPVYSGPGETDSEQLTHLATQGTTDRLLINSPALQEWNFGADGVIDVFGDGSLWAVHVPGHTAGATAYLAMTTTGAQLMIGDATHTRWGWLNGVEPGTYSEDIPQSAKSLQMLEQLAAKYPQIKVHPGHQSL